MAGQIKVSQVQLGDSGTATQNFVLQTNVDGTAKLARGNAGATTQDVVNVRSGGAVNMPQNLIAFSAQQNAASSLTGGAFTKVILQTEDFDTANAFDSVTNSRFQPAVAGYYMFEGGVELVATIASIDLALYKNGAIFKRMGYNGATTGAHCGSVICYLNGSTDYVEFWCKQGAGTQNTQPTGTFFQGHLLGAA